MRGGPRRSGDTWLPRLSQQMGFMHRFGLSEPGREECVPNQAGWMSLSGVKRALSHMDEAQLGGPLGKGTSVLPLVELRELGAEQDTGSERGLQPSLSLFFPSSTSAESPDLIPSQGPWQ